MARETHIARDTEFPSFRLCWTSWPGTASTRSSAWRTADCAGRRYYERKLTEGKTKKEALRALKRRISDAMYRQLIGDAKRQWARVGKRGRLLKPA